MKKNLHAGVTVRRILFSSTLPHEDNPSIHPPEGSDEWNALAASLADEFFDPLVWNKRNRKMVSGHYRRLILMAKGFTSADMVIVDWDEKTHVARMVAANTRAGHDDPKLLAAILAQVQKSKSTKLVGMSADEVMQIVESARKKQKREATPPGDLTKMGYSLQARKSLKPQCEACTSPEERIGHHIDQNRKNNEPENIQTLCKTCHDFWHSLARRIGRKIAGRMPVLIVNPNPLNT